jgi:O-antigen ligase
MISYNKAFFSRIKDYLIIFFVFIFPISGALANLLLSLILILWIMEGGWQEKKRILLNNRLVWIIFGILIFLLISTIFSDTYTGNFLNNHGTRNEYQFILQHLFRLYMVFIVLITSKFDYLTLVKSFLLGVFISEIVSYSIFFHLIDVNYFKQLHLLSSNASYSNPTPFMHHSLYSIFLTTAILLTLDNFFNFKGFLKILATIFLISATINLFINGGRVGQLALVISITVYFTAKFKNLKMILLSLFSLFLIYLTAYNLSPIFQKRANEAVNSLKNVIKHQNYCTSWGQRIGMDIVGINILIQNPKNFIFGLGAGDAQKKLLDFGYKNYKKITKCFEKQQHLHNQYLQLWIDGGIFEIFLLIAYFIYLYKYAPSPLTLSIISVFAFSFISDVILYRSKTILLFFIISAILLKRFENKKQML